MSSSEDLKGIIGKHIVYKYGDLGCYEAYFQSENLIVYAIHGGPMKGRSAYQKCYYQKVRDNIYNISWIEETATVVTITVDFEEKKVTCFIAFSQGHWEKNNEAHGDKRNEEDLKRWRGLAKVGDHTKTHVHLDAAPIIEINEGPGNLKPVTMDMPFF
ncbi:MAG: Calycin-like protein [Benjaminiella poitrasii]|nr:MAG: Calycin-like protein [Benjaminiella poitrasii]